MRSTWRSWTRGKRSSVVGTTRYGRREVRRRYELIAPTTTVHGAGGQTVGMGPDGFIGLLKAWRTGFPDGYMVIDDLMAEGDLGVIRNTWYGTHESESTGCRRAAAGWP